jgi:8-oxo-dGTP pyrophosphatase MutT (NUDIX family)
MNNFNILTEDDIQLRLRNQVPPTYDVPSSFIEKQSRKAGVLIPFVRVEDDWHILFIRRSIIENDMHSGQVAFAGGKHEDQDEDLEATAKRETHEEIGVAPEDIRILGQLSPHHSISQFQITPVVGTLPWPYNLTLDSSEVSHTFTMPLNWLADQNNHEVRHRQLSQTKKPVPVVYYDKYDGELLWGATARMTLSLINTLRA